MIMSYADPEIIQRPAIHTAAVRDTVALANIPAFYDRAYPLISRTLAAAGVSPSAAPMGITHGEPGELLDLSAAIPVADPFAATGEVIGETLPAGRTATLLVTGDYSQLADAYGYLYRWIGERSLTPSGLAWEQYLTEPHPDADPALNQTLLAVAID